jgi:hypothetical protein
MNDSRSNGTLNNYLLVGDKHRIESYLQQTSILKLTNTVFTQVDISSGIKI